MAKTRLTTSETSLKNCFIEVKRKASFKLSERANDGNEADKGDKAELDVEATLPAAKNGICQTSEVSIPKVGVTREESFEETEDDDKSDYGAESFCSEDSYKGSEVTNVTPRSSMSGCSSLLNSTGLKYDKRITELIENRKSPDEVGEGLTSLANEMKYLSEDEETLIADRRQLTRSGRRNMSFTNDELRKIERENHLLLKKIMSHQKPQGKGTKANSEPPRTSSSAINRRRQQRKIEEDNMMLLRRIQQAKPCAMPRTSAPSYRLATI